VTSDGRRVGESRWGIEKEPKARMDEAGVELLAGAAL